MSKARVACGVRVEKIRAAKEAWDGRDFKGPELGFLLRILRVILLEKGGKRSEDLVVLGVGGESKILVPKKFEESRGLVVVVEAMGLTNYVVWCLCSVALSRV